MRVVVEKANRLLMLFKDGRVLLRAPVALGRVPQGAKTREGDGRTPEGVYTVCMVKAQGKYGKSLGISYPGERDAQLAYTQGDITAETRDAIMAAHREGRRPPWGTVLGGEIYLHEGPVDTDWTQGCIALRTADMAVLFDNYAQIESIDIRP